jgi:hypothetical protein
VVVLVLTLGGSKKSGLNGAYTCRVPNQSGTITLTLKSGNKYTLNRGGTGGTFTRSGDAVRFHGGDLNNETGTFNSGAKSLTFDADGITVTCKK